MQPKAPWTIKTMHHVFSLLALPHFWLQQSHFCPRTSNRVKAAGNSAVHKVSFGVGSLIHEWRQYLILRANGPLWKGDKDTLGGESRGDDSINHKNVTSGLQFETKLKLARWTQSIFSLLSIILCLEFTAKTSSGLGSIMPVKNVNREEKKNLR